MPPSRFPRWSGDFLAGYDGASTCSRESLMKLIHTVFEPEGSGPFPAVVAFHGWGANAFDLLGLAPYLAAGQFLMLCPQGPIEVPLGGPVGYGWYPISMTGARPSESSVEYAVSAAITFVDEAVARYPIDPRKLAVL